MSLKTPAAQDPDAEMSDVMTRTRRRRADAAATAESVNPTVELVEHPRESRLNRIARRAHAIYEERGGEQDKALQDWLQAEREIDATETEG
jgi:hypothetical protein